MAVNARPRLVKVITTARGRARAIRVGARGAANRRRRRPRPAGNVSEACSHMRLSEKTHVCGVANRPLAAAVHHGKATGRDRHFLRSIVRRGRGRSGMRPSFAELVDAIDEFLRRPRMWKRARRSGSTRHR